MLVVFQKNPIHILLKWFVFFYPNNLVGRQLKEYWRLNPNSSKNSHGDLKFHDIPFWTTPQKSDWLHTYPHELSPLYSHWQIFPLAKGLVPIDQFRRCISQVGIRHRGQRSSGKARQQLQHFESSGGPSGVLVNRYYGDIWWDIYIYICYVYNITIYTHTVQ